MTQDIEKLEGLITDVRLDIRELNTKMDGIKDLNNKVDGIAIATVQNTDSSKSAHHRIDRIDKIIYWALTTFGGALIIAVAVWITKGGLTTP